MPQKVNAIVNGHEILQSLAAQEIEQGVTEIAKATGISPSSCFNILRTLTDLDLVRFNEKTKGYALGLGIFELARKGLSQEPILAAAQPFLVTLAEQYSAALGLWDIVPNGGAVLIAMGQNSSAARIHLQIGSRQPLAAGATGRASLSLADTVFTKGDTWLKSRFNEVKWQGDIGLEGYIEDIHLARELGYAVDRDKYYQGMTSVSAAFDERKTGRQYCVTAVLLSGAHDDASIQSIGNELKSVAKTLANLSA